MGVSDVTVCAVCEEPDLSDGGTCRVCGAAACFLCFHHWCALCERCFTEAETAFRRDKYNRGKRPDGEYFEQWQGN